MRTAEKSSLDFTYWLLNGIETNYQDERDMFVPTTDETIMYAVVRNAASIANVEMAQKFDSLMADVARYEAAIGPETAFHTRGAVLHRDGALTVSVGDRRRLVGIDRSTALSIYRASDQDLLPSSWDGAFLIPGMRYL